MNTTRLVFLLGYALSLALVTECLAGTLVGYLRDQNWFARFRNNPFGVGYYEFAVNANGTDLTLPGGADDTDVYGCFQMSNLAAGNYTVVSWDVWWRSAYAFNVTVPASGSSGTVDLRLTATMWGYPAFWDDTGYYEFGQTFVASGAISMIYVRCPYNTSYALTVHEEGPGGRQVGVSRSFNGGDQRPIYGYGDMPTVAGKTYYARIRTASPTVKGVIMQMDPRPDFSDPMPGGCLWLGDASRVTPYPDRDLGLVIMSDDDGLITDLYARSSGTAIADATSVGQTFVARGAGLISAAFWLADPAAPYYQVRVLENGPGGAQVGTAKKGKPARVNADPEMLVAWAPGECPLTPGQAYYLEVTKSGGGTLYSIYVNRSDPFRFGQAYRNGSPLAGVDLAGTIMEEQSPGSAARPRVQITSGPAIAETDRGTNQLTVRWTTDTPSDSLVELALNNPPYSNSWWDTNLTTDHAVRLGGLAAHSLYHYRVQSAANDCRTAVSRDLVVCTRPRLTNLLANPGFEAGSGPSPRRTIPNWTKINNLDIAAADGSWFAGIPPHSGGWLLEGAVNGSESDACVYQRVPVTPAKEYTFSAWVTTWMQENSAYKYDVWQDRGRLIHLRLGIDPAGGASPTSTRIQWTPRLYSHLRYSNPAITATAQTSYLTVFIHMKGQGGQWHLYGVDDCVLTEVEPTPPRLQNPRYQPGVGFGLTVAGKPGQAIGVEASPDLRQWQTLTNLVNTNGTLPFVDPEATAIGHRFYRAQGW